MSANKIAAFKALDSFASSNTSLVEGLIKAGYATIEEARPIVIEWAAARTGCKLVKSEHHLAKTPMVFDKNDKAFETARKAVQRVMLVLTAAAEPNKSSNKAESASKAKDEIAVPADIAALAAKLVAACAEYEGAKKLAAQAVAEAFVAAKAK